MDFIKRAYVTKMKLAKNSSELTQVRWFKCAAGAKVFPHLSAFRSGIWDRQSHRSAETPDYSGVGEQWPSPFKTVKDTNPQGFLGTNFCGDAELFLTGRTIGKDATFITDAFGVPPCCERPTAIMDGGEEEGGDAEMMETHHVDAAGSLRLSGQATYYYRPNYTYLVGTGGASARLLLSGNADIATDFPCHYPFANTPVELVATIHNIYGMAVLDGVQIHLTEPFTYPWHGLDFGRNTTIDVQCSNQHYGILVFTAADGRPFVSSTDRAEDNPAVRVELPLHFEATCTGPDFQLLIVCDQLAGTAYLYTGSGLLNLSGDAYANATAVTDDVPFGGVDLVPRTLHAMITDISGDGSGLDQMIIPLHWVENE